MSSRSLLTTSSSTKLMMICSDISVCSDFVGGNITMSLSQIVCTCTVDCSEVHLHYIVESKFQYFESNFQYLNHYLDWLFPVGKNQEDIHGPWLYFYTSNFSLCWRNKLKFQMHRSPTLFLMSSKPLNRPPSLRVIFPSRELWIKYLK